VLGNLKTWVQILQTVEFIWLVTFLFNKVALKNFLGKLAFLALFVAAQCTLNSSKAQLRFAYFALVLQIAFCYCGATFFKLRAHLWSYPSFSVLAVLSWLSCYGIRSRLFFRWGHAVVVLAIMAMSVLSWGFCLCFPVVAVFWCSVSDLDPLVRIQFEPETGIRIRIQNPDSDSGSRCI
jgi:hypothetical protein